MSLTLYRIQDKEVGTYQTLFDVIEDSYLLEDLRKTKHLLLPQILARDGIQRLPTNSETPWYQFNFLRCEYSRFLLFSLQ